MRFTSPRRKLLVAASAAALLAGVLVWVQQPDSGTTAVEERVERTNALKARVMRSPANLQPTVQAESDSQARSTSPPLATAPPAAIAERDVVDPDTLLVRFGREVSSEGARDAVEDSGGEIESSIAALGIKVVSTAGRPRSEVASRLGRDPRVDRVEANPVRFISDDPDDELYPYQSHLLTSRLPAAWDVTHGVGTVDVAVLDTGVDLDHPDLTDRIGTGIDVVNGDAVAADDHGHGTMVSGVAAAEADNAIGVAGVAWSSRIMPVKVLATDGSGTDGDIASGIVWASDHGAEVINMSFGGFGTSTTLSDAVDYALSKGKVVVASAGNESSNEPSYPAAYNGVVAVGATDERGDLVYFSNRGTWVDVVAQGWNVVSTAMASGPAEAYAVAAGTSFSAPVVSGVAALVRARNPSWTPAQVAAKLRSSAIDRGPDGIDDHYGWGLVDAYAAVGGRTAAPAPVPISDALEPNDVPARARTLTLGVSESATISPEGDVDWFYVDLQNAGTLTVSVTPPAEVPEDPKVIDADVAAWTPALDLLGEVNAQPAGVAETLSVPVAGAGRYYVRIMNMSSSRSPGPAVEPASYGVAVSVLPGDPPVSSGDRLWVRSITPAGFATGVAGAMQPVVEFARPLDASSVTSSSVRLVDAQTNAAVAASRNYDSGSDTVTIAPNQALVAGRPYVVHVNGVKDVGGASMGGPFISRFTVNAAAADVDLKADFNGDGFEDVVIGVPAEDLSGKTDAGVVQILYGSASGVSGSGSQMWSQNSSGILGGAESGDRFGDAVATGDLNVDGYDDLVIAAPREDLGSKKDAGAIHVLLGSVSGVRADGDQLWTQDSSGVPGAAETGDRFGGAVAVGDFDNAAGNDVAIGSPGEAIGAASGAGALHVLRGTSLGLTGSGASMWTQNSPGIEFFAEAGDGFATALAAGDFHGDMHDDLAVGAPSDKVLGVRGGSVTLMRGSIVGLRPATVLADIISPDQPETGDRFGAAVAIGDLGGLAPTDAYEDLIVGIPGQRRSQSSGAGRIGVVYSDHSDPWVAAESLDQASFGLGVIEANAGFGGALAADKLSGRGSLAAGAPLDDLGPVSDAGSVHVFAGGGSQLPSGYHGAGGVVALTQDTPGVPDGAETGDRLGASVSLADVDGDGETDLMTGSPDESLGSAGAAGAVFVIRDVASPARSATQFTQNTPEVAGEAESGDRFGTTLGRL